tara:strand:- start:41 stop:223 length:183 start_codon:yes stop_codon:yes gene_type:complete
MTTTFQVDDIIMIMHIDAYAALYLKSLEADAVIAVMAAIADRKDSRASAPLWHVRHLSVF